MRRMVPGLLAAMLYAMSCGAGDPVGPDGEGDWLPMAVGNRWVYAVENVFVSSDTDDDTSYVTGVNVVTVTGLTTHLDGFDLFVLSDSTVVTVTNPDTTFVVTTALTDYVRAADEGVWVYPDTFTSYTVHELDLPLVTGGFWQPYPGSPATRTVTSKSVTVTVPAGTFADCAQLTDVDPEAPTWASSRLYARGVGLVQANETYSAAEWSSVENSTLVSFTVD